MVRFRSTISGWPQQTSCGWDQFLSFLIPCLFRLKRRSKCNDRNKRRKPKLLIHQRNQWFPVNKKKDRCEMKSRFDWKAKPVGYCHCHWRRWHYHSLQEIRHWRRQSSREFSLLAQRSAPWIKAASRVVCTSHWLIYYQFSFPSLLTQISVKFTGGKDVPGRPHRAKPRKIN